MSESHSSNIHEEIQSDHNWLESLMRKIPGFKGYLEMRDRREADQLLRQTISSRLEEVRLEFSHIHQDLSSDIIKAIDFAEPLGRIDNGLMGLIGKIKDAPQGYSGFFDAVKVDAESLQQLYQFDEGMMHHGDLITTSVAALQKAVNDDGDIKGTIRDLDRAVKDANATFNSRQEILSKTA
jgi:hypothetical protein